MATTTNRAYPYPVPGSDPDVPYWAQQLAEKLDTDVEAQVQRILALEKQRYAEFTGPVRNSVAGGTQTLGGLTPNASIPAQNQDFVTATGVSAGQLKITRAGVYSIEMVVLPANSMGATNVRVRNMTTGTMFAANVAGNYGSWEASAHATRWIAANDVLEFQVVTANGGINFGSNVAITRHGV